MNDWQCFDVTMDAGVAHVRMNHPERHNSMVVAFWSELPRLVRALDEAGGTRVMVLSSVGKHFTAGMDLGVFASAGTLGTANVHAREQFRQQLKRLQESFNALADARFPVIAAIQGACIGGGVDLTTACCLRYCSRDAYFSIHEINIGMMADVGTLGTANVHAREQFRQQLKKLQESFNALANARFPVIAAIQGACIGGGVDLTTACCLRYCSRDAYFSIHEINIGMMADVGTLNRMPKLIPEAVMRELAYTGDRLGAERAERLGFVNGLFDDHAALLAGVLAVAHKIASKAPVAIAATKEMIDYSRDHSVAESFAYLNALQPGVFDPEDIARAVTAQKSGQPASFTDLAPIKPAMG